MSKLARAVTMAEIAERAGVSQSAVSMALRRHPRIAAATCDRVARLAEEMGYHPNPLVAALMTSRRRRTPMGAATVAMLTKFDTAMSDWKKRRPFYSDLLEGLTNEAAGLGFRLEEFPTAVPDAPGGDRLTTILTSRGIVGVLLFPSGAVDRPYAGLDWARFATVAVAFHARQLPVHRTAYDFARGMERSLMELARLGYERPGLAMTSCLDPEIGYAASGRFLAWQQGLPASRRVPLVPGAEPRPSRAAFERWVRRERPDCVIELRDLVDLWLLEMNLQTPRDLGYVLLSLRGRRDVAGIDHDPALVGRSAISLLARELYLNRRGLSQAPEVVLVNGIWHHGPTI